MKGIVSILVVAAALLAFAIPCGAGKRTRTDLTPSIRIDDDSGSKFVSLSIPSIPKGTRVTYAEVTFQTAVSHGLEIELWENPGDDSVPWDKPIPSLGRRMWVTSNTNAVRFDVTDLVQAWLSSGKNQGVLIRVSPGQLEADLVLDPKPDVTFKYHSR